MMNDYSWTSAFDTDDRITQFDRQNGETRSWELDKIGNISSFTLNGEKEMRTFNAVNELVKVKGKPKLKYDAKGNLTKGHDRKKLTWDIDNHLASISASGAKLLATYTYDALGRRVSKATRTTKKGKGKGKGHDSHGNGNGNGHDSHGNGNGNGHDSHGNGNGYGHHDHDTVTTTYVCHGNQVIEEYVNGAYAKCYAYGAYIDDCVASIAPPTSEGGQPVVTTYHRDRQFNTIALTDSTGGVDNLCAYTPYGDMTCTDASGTVVDASTLDNEYWYTGRRLDKESGLWYFRARYFSSEMGTFVSRDPLSHVDGQGLYNGYFAMVFGADPLGLITTVVNAKTTAGHISGEIEFDWDWTPCPDGLPYVSSLKIKKGLKDISWERLVESPIYGILVPVLGIAITLNSIDAILDKLGVKSWTKHLVEIDIAFVKIEERASWKPLGVKEYKCTDSKGLPGIQKERRIEVLHQGKAASLCFTLKLFGLQIWDGCIIQDKKWGTVGRAELLLGGPCCCKPAKK